GGLAYSTTSEGLREFFTQCGNVLSATVITDRFSGQSRGVGVVEMNTAEEAQASISQLNGRELDGRRITVEISNPQAARTGGGGGGRPGGGGGRGGGGGGPGGGGGRDSGYAHRPSKPVKWECAAEEVVRKGPAATGWPLRRLAGAPSDARGRWLGAVEDALVPAVLPCRVHE